MRKTTTACCALCQINNVGDHTPIDHLKHVIDRLKVQKENNTEVGISTGDGQTAAFVIVSPGEVLLENNLIELGFELKHTFERRVGYPKMGDLKMYIINL